MVWFYKWLPIIFGCHCRDDRSFYYKGRKFPICARCTGELVGIVIGTLFFIFFQPKFLILLFVLIPMILDGSIQMLTTYESTNLRRLVTGVLFGYGLVTLFLISSSQAVSLGISLGKNM